MKGVRVHYLDAVYENDDIIFNSSPEETVKFLLEKEERVRQFYWIIRGENLVGYSCKDYLLWMRAI